MSGAQQYVDHVEPTATEKKIGAIFACKGGCGRAWPLRPPFLSWRRDWCVNCDREYQRTKKRRLRAKKKAAAQPRSSALATASPSSRIAFVPGSPPSKAELAAALAEEEAGYTAPRAVVKEIDALLSTLGGRGSTLGPGSDIIDVDVVEEEDATDSASADADASASRRRGARASSGGPRSAARDRRDSRPYGKNRPR